MPAANTTVTATYCSTRSDFTYTDNGSDITITGYTGSDTDIIIPSNIIGKPVVEIGDNAFKNNTTLTSVIIPDSVTIIGSSAFYGCTGLTSITIPNSVTSIGNYAFVYCSSLTSITIPDSVTTIYSQAFQGSALISINIPS